MDIHVSLESTEGKIELVIPLALAEQLSEMIAAEVARVRQDGAAQADLFPALSLH